MRRVSIFLAGIALLAALAGPATAAKAPEPYACQAWLVRQVEAGTFWIDGDGVHLRGAIMEYALVGDALCAGTLVGSANFNLDPATGAGLVWGRATIELDAFDGGWVATLNAHFTDPDPLAPDAEDIWLGRSVRHGFGELEGWQARSTLLERYHWLFLDEGVAFAAGG